MSDPRAARRGGAGGGPSKLLKTRNKYSSEATSFEKHWEGHFVHFIRDVMASTSDTQFRDRLIASSNEKDMRERVIQGLMYGLLTEPENTNKYFSYLGEIATDNWYSVLCNMNMILFEYFLKITDQAKAQIVQFFRLAIRANVGKIDNVIMNMVRYGSDGTDFAGRVKLIKQVVEMLSEKEGKEWVLGLKGLSLLMPTLLNIVVRMVVDMPQGAASESTRTLFLNFAFFIVARRLQCCLYLGRDLLLILMRVARTSQFSPLWRDLIKNPGQFGGAFKNVQDLLNRPPHQSTLPLKMSIPMQRQVEFMLCALRHGSHEKHLEWFTEWHLRASDSSSLRADIIRFALSSAHSKELQPEMRAALAYAMITGNAPGAEMQWSKLVLWWDWFGYLPGENPMAIENTHFVVRYAINTQPVIGQTLLEFAMREMSKLNPPLTAFFRGSFNNAYRAISERHGPTAVQYVLENARLDSSIRELIKTELFGKPPAAAAAAAADKRGPVSGPGARGGSKPAVAPPPSSEAIAAARAKSMPPPASAVSSSSSSSSSTLSATSTSSSSSAATAPSAHFSVLKSESQRSGLKREAEKNGEKKQREEERSKQRRREPPPVAAAAAAATTTPGGSKEGKEIEDAIKGLKGELRTIAVETKNVFTDDNADEGEKCEKLQRLMEFIQGNEELHEEDSQLERVGHLLGCLVRPLVPPEGTTLLPEKGVLDRLENDALSECFSGPLYVVFRSLSVPESRTAIESIISWMREKDSAVTYLLLFFLKVYSEDANLPCASYENVATHMESTLDQRLTEDLELMAKDDRRLFTFCLPFVFKSFAIVASGCVGLFRTFCQYADSEILTHFLGAVYREDIVLFRKDSFTAIVNDSLEWEGVAEMMFWQLVSGDGVNAEWFYPLYSRVSSTKNAVAAGQLLILLKRHEPNTSLVRAVMSRALATEDHFTTSAIKLLIEDEDSCAKTAEILASVLKKQMSANEILVSSVNSKSSSKTKNGPGKLSMEHIFFHLTELTSRCLVKEKRMTEQLLTTPAFRDCMQSIRKSEKAAALYTKFDGLFSFVDVLDEQKNSSRSLRANRSGTSRGTKREATTIEEDPKKRKKPSVYIVDSDSD